MIDDTALSDISVASEALDNDSPTTLKPPIQGNSQSAEKYLSQLMALIDQDKLKIAHTDLNKLSLTSLQDHYSLDLNEYQIELSHSKQAETGKDYYIMLFNNIKKMSACPPQKVILAYIHLTPEQFSNFKQTADAHIEKKRIEEEKKRFEETMAPIDQALEELNSNSTLEDVTPEDKKTEETTEQLAST
jgi:hypothetical protein